MDNNLNEFDKAVILCSLCTQFEGWEVKPIQSNGGVLMFAIEGPAVFNAFTFYAPLGTGFSAFRRRKNIYTALLHFYDVEAYCNHYKLSADNENIS